MENLSELEKLAQLNEERFAKIQEVTAQITNLTGIGYAADERIKAVIAGGSALKELHLDPRVMRMDSKTLSENIVSAANAASEDLQHKIEEAMSAVSDESPFDFLNGKVDPAEKLREVQESFQQSADSIMTMAEKIRRNLLKQG